MFACWGYFSIYTFQGTEPKLGFANRKFDSKALKVSPLKHTRYTDIKGIVSGDIYCFTHLFPMCSL